jgi:hypothetical protein
VAFALFDQVVCDCCAGISCANNHDIGVRRKRIGRSVIVDRLDATSPERCGRVCCWDRPWWGVLGCHVLLLED